MADYRNAGKADNEQKTSSKKLEKVVKGSVKPKKKSGFRKFMDAFVQEDIGTIKAQTLFVIISNNWILRNETIYK